MARAGSYVAGDRRVSPKDRLDLLVEHPALAGPERTLLQARLAEIRGDRDRAQTLVRTCLTALPGHQDFRAFAEDVGVSMTWQVT